MTCPAPIVELILDILSAGLLECRVSGWSGDAESCAGLADYLHNLPSLLADYKPELLRFHLDVEAPSFATRLDSERIRFWQSKWDRLRPFVEELDMAEAAA
jgi:hypothetical protein